MAYIPLIRNAMNDAAVQSFISNIEDAKTGIHFAQVPTADMIQSMFKWGPKSENFVDVAYDNAKVRLDLLPPSFQIGDFEMDMTLVRTMRTLLPRVEQLYKMMTGSIMILQSQVMNKSTLFYNIVRECYESGMGDLQPLYEQLQQRFPGGHKEAEEEETPAAPQQ